MQHLLSPQPSWGPFIMKPTTWLSPVCCNHRQPEHATDITQTVAARFPPDKCNSPHRSPGNTQLTPFLSFSTISHSQQCRKRAEVKDITDALGLYNRRKHYSRKDQGGTTPKVFFKSTLVYRKYFPITPPLWLPPPQKKPLWQSHYCLTLL